MLVKRLVSLFIFTGVLAFFLLFFFLQEAYPPTPRELLVEEDFIQELQEVTFKLHTFDERQFLELTAERIIEHPYPKDSILYAIKGWIYEEEELFLYFQGERGFITPARDRLQLESPIFFKGEDTVFTSGYLLWEMAAGVIYGGEGVSYQDEQLRVTADGLSYDLEEKTVYLRENVRLSFKKEE